MILCELYAKAGIPDYWIVNLVDKQLELFRDPIQLEDGSFVYRTTQLFRADESIAPLEKPDAKINVADLMP